MEKINCHILLGKKVVPIVETEDGGKYRRNRMHLRKSKETPNIF